MKKVFFLVLVFVLVSSLLEAQPVRTELLTRIENWTQAQEDGDFAKLKGFYASGFKSGTLDLKDFISKKRQELGGHRIWIGLEDFKVLQSSDKQAKVAFKEYILKDSEITHQELTLNFICQGEEWKIVKEEVVNRDPGYKYCAQLIPFERLAQARRFCRDLKEAGFESYIYEAEIEGQKVFVLRLGDFKALDQAEDFLKVFSKRTVLQAYLSRVDSLTPLQVGAPGVEEAKKEITVQPVAKPVQPRQNEASVQRKPGKAGAEKQYGVHLASYRSRATALENWKKIKKNHPGLFKGLSYYLKKVDLGSKGIYYRLIVGQLSRAGAYDLLEKLKKIVPGVRVVRLKPLPVQGEWAVEEDVQVAQQGKVSPGQGAGGAGPSVAGSGVGQSGSSGPFLSPGPAVSQKQAPSGPTLGGPGISVQAPGAGPVQGPGSLAKDVQQLKEQVARLRREAEARKKLQVTEAEQKKKEEQILEAAGRQYTLLRAGTIGLEYDLSYSYYSYDAIEESVTIEHHSNHNLRNTLVAEYALLDNLTLNVNVPFVYKFDKVGTSTSSDVTDLGDISLGVKYQPIKSGGDWPAPILSMSLSTPTGRGAYEINPDTELSTGSSLYSLSSGLSFSKSFDPVSGFASINYSHGFSRDGLNQRRGSNVLKEVVPGDSIGASIGLGYALSYKVSLSLSYSYSYAFETDYHWGDGTTSHSGTAVSSSFSLSSGWHLTPAQSVIVGIGVGLTDSDADFSFSFRYPFQFSLK